MIQAFQGIEILYIKKKEITDMMNFNTKVVLKIYLMMFQIILIKASNFQNKIGKFTYGSNDSSCYQWCERGQICKIENQKTICTPYCGDGIVVGKEKLQKGCDDGNSVNGDGCTKCKIDALYQCKEQPSKCTYTCGNGKVQSQSGQQCDDGNKNQADGCTSYCKISTGWKCPTTCPNSLSSSKSECEPICGDGLLVGPQLSPTKCDDNNTKNNDGCSQKCEIQKQWTCCNVPSVCHRKCGNGVYNVGQECDDGNDNQSDGCFKNCTIDAQYWRCKNVEGFPSVCEGICGDGVLVGKEKQQCGCDEGNVKDKDGCRSNCEVEPGWDCQGQPSVCQPVCGDGILVGIQLMPANCDDSNKNKGDGCYNCKLQPLYQCTGQPSMCTRKCGNSKLQKQFGQQCDNGDSQISDGCSNNCTIQQNWKCQTPANKQSNCTPSNHQCNSTCKKSAPFPYNYCYTQSPHPGCINCLIVQGWKCKLKQKDTQYFECMPICGDNKIIGSQVSPGSCDTVSEGCKECRVVEGWECKNEEGKQSQCWGICGDGRVVGEEVKECDDGNQIDGDGCSKQCKVQPNWTCYSNGGPSKCSIFNTCIKIQDKDPYCFIDCSKLYFNKIQQSCAPIQHYCNDLNSQPNDGCTNCKLDPFYIISQNMVVPSKKDPKYEAYRISYVTLCGNQRIDQNQTCDYTVWNRDCHKRCNYKQSMCGNYGGELEQKCDYFWGCLNQCKGFQQGWSKAAISNNYSDFLNPHLPQNKRMLTTLLPQLSPYTPYINQILLNYYSISESSNFDLTSLSWQQIQQLFRINSAYFSPQHNLQQYHPIKLTIQLFVARLSRMSPGSDVIRFYYKSVDQRLFLKDVMSQVLIAEGGFGLKVEIVGKSQALKRHF